MPRAKGSKNKLKVEVIKFESPTTKTVVHHDFGDDLPKVIELESCELHKVDGYKHQVKGRFWRDGSEIVCVLLIEKHK